MSFDRKNSIFYKLISLLSFPTYPLLLVSLLYYFEAENGYFVRGEVTPVLFWAFFLFGTMLCIVPAFFTRRAESVRTDDLIWGKDKTALALVGTVVVVLGAINLLFNAISRDDTVCLLFSIGQFAFGSYLLLVAVKGYGSSPTKSVLLFLSGLIPIASMLNDNSNYMHHMNSVENTLCAVFGIAFLIYIIYEGNRIATGTHSRWHFPAMLFVSHAGLAFSAPYMLAYVFGAVDDDMRFFRAIVIFMITVGIRVLLERYVNIADSHTDAEWAELKAAELKAAEFEATEIEAAELETETPDEQAAEVQLDDAEADEVQEACEEVASEGDESNTDD